MRFPKGLILAGMMWSLLGCNSPTPETKPELAAQSAATTAGKAAPTTEVQKTAESTPAPPTAKSEPSPSATDQPSKPAPADSAGPAGPAEPGDSVMAKGETPANDIPSSPQTKVEAKPISVSTMRLAILSAGGPKLIKLDVHVDGQDLVRRGEDSANQVAKELGFDLATGATWNELLDKPLVASGWLGNLVATAEQRDQLINLYDTDKNSRVESPEFRAFITRGLSRGVPLRLSTGAEIPPLIEGESPWGPLDKNQDGQLDQAEIDAAASSVMKYDFDADRIVTVGELRASLETPGLMMGSSNARGLVDYKPVISWDMAKPDALAGSLLDYYTYSEGITRDLFDTWDDRRFQLLDSNQDKHIKRDELKKITDEILHASGVIGFPDALNDDGSAAPAAAFQPTLPLGSSQETTWSLHEGGGRLDLEQCILTINVSDDYSQQSKARFIELVQQAKRDSQLQAAIQSALDLKGEAFDLVRGDDASHSSEKGDATTSSGGGSADTPKESSPTDASMANSPTRQPPEARAWGWVVGLRQYQVQVSWALSKSPWFELLDQNADSRLVNGELAQFSKVAKRLDKDRDGLLGREEMPISVVLTVRRSDPRGAVSRLGGTVAEKRGTNAPSAPTWFTGMDYNSDGELSQSEFLGEPTDFEKLDRNRDGVIEAREINAP